jgi:hypothetical protein
MVPFSCRNICKIEAPQSCNTELDGGTVHTRFVEYVIFCITIINYEKETRKFRQTIPNAY